MEIHKIKVGDIIQYGIWSMNGDVDIPALYKIVSIETGTGGMNLKVKSMNNHPDYWKIIEVMKLGDE